MAKGKVAFYARKGDIQNYLYSFKCDNEERAKKLLTRFKGIRSAWYIDKQSGIQKKIYP